MFTSKDVVRTLYRSCMANARRIDDDAALKCLLWRHRVFARDAEDPTSPTNDWYTDVLGDSEAIFYQPNRARELSGIPARQTRSLASVVRARFRSTPLSDEALDLGFLAVRELNRCSRVARRLGLLDAVAAVARPPSDLLPSQAPALPGPTPSPSLERMWETDSLARGVVLVAHPFLVGGVLTHSVVLITEYSRERGAVGLVLNRPWPQYRRDAIAVRGFDGGVLHPSRWLLHDGTDGGDEVAPGVRCVEIPPSPPPAAGAPPALAPPRDARREKRLFGKCAWYPGQLEKEVRSGTWVCVTRATPGVVWMDFDDALVEEGRGVGEEKEEDGEGAGVDEEVKTRNRRTAIRWRDMYWKQCLRMLGGEYAQIAKLAPVSSLSILKEWKRAIENSKSF